MAKNKHFYLFGGILLFCLVLFVLVYVYDVKVPGQPTTAPDTTIDETSRIRRPSDDGTPVEELTPKEAVRRDLNVLADALKTVDVNTCNAIADVTLRNSCSQVTILARARAQKDPSICEEIKEPSVIARCKEKTEKYIAATN